MKYLLFLIFSLISICQPMAQGQKSLIITREDNYQWIERLKTLKFDEKILELKERITSDTNSVFNQCCVDGHEWKKPINKEITECKPTINIGGTIFHFANEVSVASIIEFASLLSPKKFKAIRIYTDKDEHASAVYGITSACGIIVLEPRNKRVKQKFASLEFRKG